jgi:hypothetical protein
VNFPYKFLGLLIPLLITLSVVGCGEKTETNGKKNMDSYTHNQVTIENITQEEDKLKIKYYTFLETLYYCPGVKIEDDEDSISLRFIRCSIKDTCQVDLEPIKDKSGNKFLTINNKEKKVFMKDESGRHKIYPTR